jgi:hypothetical protein
MTLDETLADLQYQAARLAGHFAAISDRIEAGEAPSPSDFQNSSFATRLTADSMPIPVRQDTPGAVEVEGEAATPAVAPPPAAPVAPAPWEQQAQAAAEPAPAAEPTPAAEAAPKKRSRRTLEEIAADNGVTLDEVKAWLGPDRKATKAAIEEYAALQESAAPQAVKDLDAQPEPAVAPAPAPMPTTVANPFGQGAQLPPAAPVVNATPQAEPVAAPAPPAPVAPVAAPDFGQGTETIADWNPFQS